VTDSRRLLAPWNRPCDLYSPPGRMLVQLRLGEAPDAIPTALDVRDGGLDPERRFGIATLDRVLGHFADRVAVTRVHDSAASLGRIGSSNRGFDELEHVLGLSRTFEIETDHMCCVEDVVEALRQTDVVAT